MSNEYAFRKIDIDALEGDILLPSDLYDPDPRGPDGALADAQARSQESRGQVSRWVAHSRSPPAPLRGIAGPMALFGLLAYAFTGCWLRASACALAVILRDGLDREASHQYSKLTCRGDIAGALQTILTDPPYGEGVDQAKVSGVLGTQLSLSGCSVIELASDSAPRGRPTGA